jgi:hypothetical protein
MNQTGVHEFSKNWERPQYSMRQESDMKQVP